MSLLARLRRTLLPASCQLCGDDSEDALLCSPCAADLPAPPTALCTRCALARNHQGECPHCSREAPVLDATVALFPYDFPVDRLIQALKYGHHLGIARWLGDLLAAHPALPVDAQVLAMPLHPTRLQARGFNQAQEIARPVAKKLGCRLPADWLIRRRATAPQAQLSQAERQKNLCGAFDCQVDLTGRHLILVDDVMTTGHTLNEAARVLKLHGARRVTAAVAARAQQRMPESA